MKKKKKKKGGPVYLYDRSKRQGIDIILRYYEEQDFNHIRIDQLHVRAQFTKDQSALFCIFCA